MKKRSHPFALAGVIVALLGIAAFEIYIILGIRIPDPVVAETVPVPTSTPAIIEEPPAPSLPVMVPKKTHNVPADGMIGFWDFNECSGSNALDQSGFKNKGYTNGNVVWSSETKDGEGCALRFSDDYEYVTTGPSEDINVTGDIGISAWVKPSDLKGDQGILDKTDNSLWNFSFYLHGNKVAFASTYLTPATTTSIGVVSGTDWHNVIATRQGETVNFYIDGMAAGTTTMSGEMGTDFVSLVFGTHRFRDQFKGSIDDVRLYKRYLTPDDVALLYADRGERI